MFLLTLVLLFTFSVTRGMAETAPEYATSAGSSVSTPSESPRHPLSERFASTPTAEIPDFQKHVIPLMGRLGCNGRSCHGSFQGRGGFQLSLFGYDFKSDYKALLDEESGRVDVDDVAESLILSKPIDEDMHEGGKRFDRVSWQYNVLSRWIQAGASFENSRVQTLNRLELIPSEIQFKSSAEDVQLKVIAHWEDGSAEDVTELARFRSNNDSIASVDQTGHVRSGEPGDTHVVVFYDSAVVPVPVIQPVGPTESRSFTNHHPIDRLVEQKLSKLGIVPSERCTDAEFIRRVSFDVTGVLPDADRVRRFLNDSARDKRETLVEELLASPSYGAWWATRLSDWTGNSEEQLNNVLPVRGAGTRLWHEWLRVRLQNNLPYDEIIEGIVTANNRQQGETYLEFCASMTKACAPGNESEFAARDGMPLYWARRNFQKPEERAIGFAYAFLGVRIECAQCHKHPFDQWSKDDFEQFSKLFTTIRTNQNLVSSDAKTDREELIKKIVGDEKLRGNKLRKRLGAAAQKGEVVPFGELLINTSASKRMKKKIVAAKKKGRKPSAIKIPQGKILGAESTVKLEHDPRTDLMQWLRSPENPYFAKAIVNRVWGNYFGIGIVDPTDDMNLANPPSNGPLLEYLANEFVNQGFDLKWLHRQIVTSQAYQRSAKTNATNIHDQANFARHIPRRLPAEVVYDAIVLATGSDKAAKKIRDDLDSMAIADGKARLRNKTDFALEVFGQSIRESNCDCDRSDSPSLLQSIYLRNDIEIHKRLSAKDGWVAQACHQLGVEGPRPTGDPKTANNRERAEASRKQFLKRLAAYRKMPQPRQQSTRPRLIKEHRRLSKRMKAMGYQVPALNSLLASKDVWNSLEPKTASHAPSTTVDQLIEQAYLRSLSRFPDPEEREIAVSFINESQSTAEGVESLLWALVNTKEFIITH